MGFTDPQRTRHADGTQSGDEQPVIHDGFECEFYFIRHGESESNTTPGIAAGENFDSAMTARGFAQARALGERLRAEGVVFDRVYASSLQRAMLTASTMLGAMGETDMQVVPVPEIIEQQLPAWRGKLTAEVITPAVQLLRASKGRWFVPADGESERAVQRRFSNWLEDEILYNPETGGKPGACRIAVVSHGAALRCLLHYILGFDDVYIRRFWLDNCSITRMLFTSEGWFPLTINDASHTLGVGDVNRDSRRAGATP